jgi:putative PEP-CTERM system histidine kinase
VASNRDLLLTDTRHVGLIRLAIAFFVGAIAAAVLTRYWQRQVRGIQRVTEGVGAIAHGQLDHRFDLSSDDLRPLADNVGLVTQQLREQMAREAESRQFESFVRLSAILTHDLKNAIEALSLTVSNMELHFEDAEFRADAMQTLRGATENLRAVVARLSQPVTTLSGEHKRPRAVDLIPMVRRVISMTAAQAEGHETVVKLPESLFAIIDIDRMQKVIENLIINALEAMGRKRGKLTIEAGTINANRVFFSVSDTGDGMSQRFISERLFHPFATTKKRGVGLGLYTCREVVRANGGTIEVTSEEGTGTTFRVVLPSAPIEGQR